MRHDLFDMLNTFNRGTRFRKTNQIKDLWFMGTDFYFLEPVDNTNGPGEVCFNSLLWDCNGSRLASCCTRIQGGGDMMLLYIPNNKERREEMELPALISFIKNEFRPTSKHARFLKVLRSIFVQAHIVHGGLTIAATPLPELPDSEYE